MRGDEGVELVACCGDARAGADILSRFDPDDIEARIRDSIEDRRLVRSAMARTKTVWAYDPDPSLFTQYWRET